MGRLTMDDVEGLRGCCDRQLMGEGGQKFKDGFLMPIT